MEITVFELLKSKKTINFDVLLKANLDAAWESWINPEKLAKWWGPEGTAITQCTVDPVLGGEIYVVMTAGSAMGKYAGTNWPMQGKFIEIKPLEKIIIEAKSWTEGQEQESLIEHTIQVEFIPKGANTQMIVIVKINKFGSKARMAAYGMKFGYKAQFKKLAELS